MGRGIVTVAGGHYFPPVLLSIRMLRARTNSTLPIQVFLSSLSEYEPLMCEEVLPLYNAECFIVSDFLRRDTPFAVRSYQLKVLAILFSRFEEVVYMDADCIALHDPEELLDKEPYTSTGFVNWPDFWIATEDRVFYEIAGMAEYPGGLPPRSTESGQMLLDKRRHPDTLVLAAYYNIFGPRFYYQILGQGAPGEGDKETFLAAAVALGRPYYRVREKAGSVGYHDDAGDYRGRGMVQHDPFEDSGLYGQGGGGRGNFTAQPRPFFLHANMAKLNIGDLVDGNEIFLGGFGERHRIWGSEEKMVKKFGYDIEKAAWWEMVDLACGLGHTLRDFKKHWRICKKARAQYKAVFDPGITF